MVTRAPHPLFNDRVGGRLSLDFVNTVRAWMPRTAPASGRDFQDVVQGERLTDYGALVEWAGWTGVIGRAETRRVLQLGTERPRDAATVHGRAQRLREAIYRLCKAHHEGWPPLDEDRALITREVHVARAQEALEAPPRATRVGGRPPYRFGWAAGIERLDRVLWPIALDAADLLTSDQLARVGQCPALGCGWLFLDTSRAGRRQWCDMAVCGNAEKVRRFRERSPAARGPH